MSATGRSADTPMTVREAGDVNFIHLQGRLDSAGIDRLEVKFNAVSAASKKHAVIDLSEVTFVASMAIRMFMLATKRVVGGGHVLVLLNPIGLVDETLEASDIYSLIPVARSEEEAMALIAG